MADLQNAAGLLCAFYEVVGLGQRSADRLFDQHVQAGLEQRTGHRMMVDRGYGHRSRVNLQSRVQQFLYRGKHGGAVLGLRFRGAARVGLHGCGKLHAGSGLFQFAVDTEMVATKGAGSGDRDTQLGAAVYFSAPLPSTALRQRP